jgi:hypothetical protein
MSWLMSDAGRWRIWRDAMVTSFALAGGGYEITIGGGRPAILTFLSGLLLSPLIARADEQRRSRNGEVDS